MRNKKDVNLIRIAGLAKESIVDGEGLRYTIFTQGCNHNCLGCHNPESHDFNGGKQVEIQEILNDILENPLLDGVTLSGGDPFFQAEKLIPLVKEVKVHKLDVWAYTGFTFEEFLKFINNKTRIECDSRINLNMIELLKDIDVLVDGKFILKQRTLDANFKGSENQRIIDVAKSLKNNRVVEYKLST